MTRCRPPPWPAPMVSPDRTWRWPRPSPPAGPRVAARPGPWGRGRAGWRRWLNTPPARGTHSPRPSPRENSWTPFLMVTAFPTTTPPSTKTWPPTLQSTRSWPIGTWANAQMRVRAQRRRSGTAAKGARSPTGPLTCLEATAAASLRHRRPRAGEPVRTAVAAVEHGAMAVLRTGVVAAGGAPGPGGTRVRSRCEGSGRWRRRPAALAGRHQAGGPVGGALVAASRGHGSRTGRGSSLWVGSRSWVITYPRAPTVSDDRLLDHLARRQLRSTYARWAGQRTVLSRPARPALSRWPRASTRRRPSGPAVAHSVR